MLWHLLLVLAIIGYGMTVMTLICITYLVLGLLTGFLPRNRMALLAFFDPYNG